MLKQRLVDKGYDATLVKLVLHRVASIDRESLLADRVPWEPDESFKFSMLTSYSSKYKDITKIFDKHWDVLKQDKVLGPKLPERAKVIFKGAPSLRNSVALML